MDYGPGRDAARLVTKHSSRAGEGRLGGCVLGGGWSTELVLSSVRQGGVLGESTCHEYHGIVLSL